MGAETGGTPIEALEFDDEKAKTNLEAKAEKDFYRQPADAAFAKKDIKLGDLESIGEVILGRIDPRNLTKEEFEKSPDLLYHGTKQDEMEFDDSIDYTTTGLESQVGSATVGNGLYTTSELRNAEIYSEIRREPGSDLKVEAFLPFQARMLDMRAKVNPRVNAPVPSDFAKDWQAFYEERVKSEYPEGRSLSIQEGFIMSHMRFYLKILESRIHEGNPIDLRRLLDQSGSGGEDTQHASMEFTAFMLSRGYDGLIYNEGGDRPDQKHITSFVFYDPKKIGTYETWQRRK